MDIDSTATLVDQATYTMTYYPDTDLTSSHPVLVMASTRINSDGSWKPMATLDQDSNS